MKRRLKHISALQLGKMLTAVYAILVIPLAVLALIGVLFGTPQSHELSPWLLVSVPIVYGIGVFIFGLFSAFAYNVTAKWLGGIEITLDD